ncbi:MAG TPA: DUF4293 domain-containing protein [Catalimonadaceae bacterium]|nr:DUF4293 domain-containing protein [Catalimonadaceae bacterium]
MLQRPQTLFLALTICMMLLALFTNNWHKASLDGSQQAVQNAFQLTISGTGDSPVTHQRYYIAFALLLVAGLAGWSISQFKNRLLQMKIGFGITLSIASALVGMMAGSKEGETLLEPTVLGVYEIGFYAPFIALFSNIITNRLIRKDERLVRSMDRIR